MKFINKYFYIPSLPKILDRNSPSSHIRLDSNSQSSPVRKDSNSPCLSSKISVIDLDMTN